jgi:hypothetical protein
LRAGWPGSCSRRTAGGGRGEGSDEADGVVASPPCSRRAWGALGVYAGRAWRRPAAAAAAPAGGPAGAEPAVYTSTLPRTTACWPARLRSQSEQLSALDPMETGVGLGLPIVHLKSQFPEEFQRWLE